MERGVDNVGCHQGVSGMRHFQHGKKEVGYRQYCLNEYFISFALCISSILFAWNLYIKKKQKKGQ